VNISTAQHGFICRSPELVSIVAVRFRLSLSHAITCISYNASASSGTVNTDAFTWFVPYRNLEGAIYWLGLMGGAHRPWIGSRSRRGCSALGRRHVRRRKSLSRSVLAESRRSWRMASTITFGILCKMDKIHRRKWEYHLCLHRSK
jgi:hypothetical protein